MLTEIHVKIFIKPHFTTWQAGQTRKGFTNLPLPVGNSQTLFHTSCGYAFFAKRWITFLAQYPENQKKPEPGADKIDAWPRVPFLHFPIFLLAAIPRFHFCSTFGKLLFSIFTALKPLFYVVSRRFLHKSFYKNSRSLFLHFFQILCYNRRKFIKQGTVWKMIFDKTALMLLTVFANTLFLLSFIFVQRGNVPFRNCKLLGFIPNLPIFGISLLLGCQKLSILCIQIWVFSECSSFRLKAEKPSTEDSSECSSFYSCRPLGCRSC